FDILYQHAKKRFSKRIEQSDVRAGTYLIIVAEGLKNSNGEELTDESAGVDAFGHKKLAGAGKFVCQELSKRFKQDASVKEFMKKEKMYVEGLYEIPEVRSVMPGHLVRCGRSSAFDANFGKEAGAAAVLLLSGGIDGVTVVGVNGNKIRYMETKEAIKQRHVDLDLIPLHETMGICFGRERQNVSPVFEKVHAPIERHL
ncbi:MAG: 6-phosphofructokinase, partial [Candidatus Omnitrophota bacterium]